MSNGNHERTISVTFKLYHSLIECVIEQFRCISSYWFSLSLNRYDDSNFGNKKQSWFQSWNQKAKKSSQKQQQNKKIVHFLVRDDYLSSWKTKYHQSGFTRRKQRVAEIPVASWLTRLTNDWINFRVCINKTQKLKTSQQINAMHNLPSFLSYFG